MQAVCFYPSKSVKIKTKERYNLLNNSDVVAFISDPCRIQTCNPHIRSVVLYSVELMDPFQKEKARIDTQAKHRYLLSFCQSNLLLSGSNLLSFCRLNLAVRTRLELATYGVTGRYSNQLNYRTIWYVFRSTDVLLSQKRVQNYCFFLIYANVGVIFLYFSA